MALWRGAASWPTDCPSAPLCVPQTPPPNAQNSLAKHVIPNLPDVTQIPDAAWPGWQPVLQEMQTDAANTQVGAADVEASA